MGKIGGGAVLFTWEEAVSDGCFEAWRIYGATDPSDWTGFEHNAVAETVATSFAEDPGFQYYLVTAARTDGTPGPTGQG